MTRPHEDLQRHTVTDHRSGGPVITFTPAAWWAIAVAHVDEERAPAAIASYETLVEKAQVSAPTAHEAAIFESRNKRRVITLLHLDGHEAFRHLLAAWDDHHLFAQRHAVDESRDLGLYRLMANVGEPDVDPGTSDAHAFERVPLSAQRTRAVVAAIVVAQGFRGATFFEADDGSASAILYRFAHAEELEAFRAKRETQRALGSPSEPGETFDEVRPVRTFAKK